MKVTALSTCAIFSFTFRPKVRFFFSLSFFFKRNFFLFSNLLSYDWTILGFDIITSIHPKSFTIEEETLHKILLKFNVISCLLLKHLFDNCLIKLFSSCHFGDKCEHHGFLLRMQIL